MFKNHAHREPLLFQLLDNNGSNTFIRLPLSTSQHRHRMTVTPLQHVYIQGSSSWRRKWLPTPVFLPGESHGQRSLGGYSPWGHKETDMTELNTLGFPAGTSGKEPACQCRRHKRCEFNPRIWKIPCRRAWQPPPVLLPGESHGQRSLAGYSP